MAYLKEKEKRTKEKKKKFKKNYSEYGSVECKNVLVFTKKSFTHFINSTQILLSIIY